MKTTNNKQEDSTLSTSKEEKNFPSPVVKITHQQGAMITS